jgi:uncharacterized protein
MKTNAMGPIMKNKIATIQECLRFAWSQDIDTVVSGAESVAAVGRKHRRVKTFKPMSRAEMTTLLARTKQGKIGVEIESYKRKPQAGSYPAHRDGDPV